MGITQESSFFISQEMIEIKQHDHIISEHDIEYRVSML
jgi:hypothetical protein